MKIKEALRIIDEKQRTGFCVSFERRVRGMLESDHFPDVRAGEPGIEGEELAWELAVQFAKAPHADPIVNIYVCRAVDFTPTAGYQTSMLNRYPPREERS